MLIWDSSHRVRVTNKVKSLCSQSDLRRIVHDHLSTPWQEPITIVRSQVRLAKLDGIILLTTRPSANKGKGETRIDYLSGDSIIPS